MSPEVISCRWHDGAAGPVVGARFETVSRAGLGRAWTNRPVVIAADPGREFAFVRTDKFAGTIVWRYRFSSADGGTLVTESFEVTEPVSTLGWVFIGTVYGPGDRRSDLRNGMRQTLMRLREVGEQLAAV